MIKDNKKLYYKYFDLYRVSEFKRQKEDSLRAQHNMNNIQQNFGLNLVALSYNDLASLGFDTQTIDEIYEYSVTKDIAYITSKVNSLDNWILRVILPEFFPIDLIRSIFRSENICSKLQLEDYFSSEAAIELYGEEHAELYCYFVSNSDNSSFPKKYLDLPSTGLITDVNGAKIYGNFHNHTSYSDGKLSIPQLYEIANSYGRSFVGISDHTKRVNGINEDDVLRQHSEIDAINTLSSSCKILKGVECEILQDGELDFSNDTLGLFDYVIAGAHRDMNMVKLAATRRLLRAIESPYTNILAHPSSRLYAKNVGLLVDMHQVIDACVDNKVVIEINGDKDRLDLDPRFIEYALNKGAMFSLDSDTHSVEGFLNINNSISIAKDFNLPAERIINTYPSFEFSKYKK